MLKNLLLVILILLPVTAEAHSPLISSFPQDGQELGVSPPNIVMIFKTPAKIIKFSLTKSKDEQRKSLLGGFFRSSKGEQITIEHDFLMKNSERHTIALPSLEKGKYSLSWRAMGEDGHVMKGEFAFVIKDG